MALSPWPTSPVALANATAALRAATGIGDDATAQRLGAVASARVEQFAPTAPDPVRDEATIRLAGYLASRPKPIRAIDLGNTRVEFATAGLARPFVYSGARALLSPFRRRRALAAVSSS